MADKVLGGVVVEDVFCESRFEKIRVDLKLEIVFLLRGLGSIMRNVSLLYDVLCMQIDPDSANKNP